MQQYSDFINQHRNDDIRDLALHASRYPSVDIPYAVQQIAAWQIAKKKLPLWAETDGIVYPVHLSMEQCSSQLTAEYKAYLLSQQGENSAKTLVDLTAGFGVDATIMAQSFRHLIYVERNEALCEIAQNNLPLLGINDFEVINADAEEVLNTLSSHLSPLGETEGAHIFYLDPARRDSNGSKTVMISDCTPDVTKLQDTLLEKADLVMIKLSPMLDITNVLKELKCVKEIHVVSVNNECKEILVCQAPQPPKGEAIQIVCVNLKSNGEKELFEFSQEEERLANCHYYYPDGLPLRGSGGFTFLYEPNTSIMKASCFKSIAQHYGVEKLHPSSHLYISDKLIADFPGRIFKIDDVYSLKDKALKNIKKANLTVRNFPSSVAELRKRLKISEGGNDYLFATTLADESKVIILCSKA